MNVVNQYGEKRNGFTEVVAFCHVTCRYFDRFLLQGVDKNWRQACFFYLAPGLICEGYWQVNSRRSIFRIADPTIDSQPFSIVEDTGFLRLLSNIYPLYAVPSRKYFAEKVIPEMFSTIKAQLMKDIHPDGDSFPISFTTDI